MTIKIIEDGVISFASIFYWSPFCFLINFCLSQPLFVALSNRHVELRQILVSVGKNCHLIERLFFESSRTGCMTADIFSPIILVLGPFHMLSYCVSVS